MAEAFLAAEEAAEGTMKRGGGGDGAVRLVLMDATMATLLELENSDSVHDEGMELDEAIEQAQQLAENMQQRYDSGARL